jgi:hypothetical protein
MASLEIFVWAILGGLFVAILSASAVYYNNQLPTNKQLSRDFLIGSVFTGFLYPLIPESFDEIKNVAGTSIGSVYGLYYILGFDWRTLLNFGIHMERSKIFDYNFISKYHLFFVLNL